MYFLCIFWICIQLYVSEGSTIAPSLTSLLDSTGSTSLLSDVGPLSQTSLLPNTVSTSGINPTPVVLSSGRTSLLTINVDIQSSIRIETIASISEFSQPTDFVQGLLPPSSQSSVSTSGSIESSSFILSSLAGADMQTSVFITPSSTTSSSTRSSAAITSSVPDVLPSSSQTFNESTLPESSASITNSSTSSSSILSSASIEETVSVANGGNRQTIKPTTPLSFTTEQISGKSSISFRNDTLQTSAMSFETPEVYTASQSTNGFSTSVNSKSLESSTLSSPAQSAAVSSDMPSESSSALPTDNVTSILQPSTITNMPISTGASTSTLQISSSSNHALLSSPAESDSGVLYSSYSVFQYSRSVESSSTSSIVVSSIQTLTRLSDSLESSSILSIIQKTLSKASLPASTSVLTSSISEMKGFVTLSSKESASQTHSSSVSSITEMFISEGPSISSPDNVLSSKATSLYSATTFDFSRTTTIISSPLSEISRTPFSSSPASVLQERNTTAPTVPLALSTDYRVNDSTQVSPSLAFRFTSTNSSSQLLTMSLQSSSDMITDTKSQPISTYKQLPSSQTSNGFISSSTSEATETGISTLVELGTTDLFTTMSSITSNLILESTVSTSDNLSMSKTITPTPVKSTSLYATQSVVSSLSEITSLDLPNTSSPLKTETKPVVNTSSTTTASMSSLSQEASFIISTSAMTTTDVEPTYISGNDSATETGIGETSHPLSSSLSNFATYATFQQTMISSFVSASLFESSLSFPGTLNYSRIPLTTAIITQTFTIQSAIITPSDADTGSANISSTKVLSETLHSLSTVSSSSIDSPLALIPTTRTESSMSSSFVPVSMTTETPVTLMPTPVTSINSSYAADLNGTTSSSGDMFMTDQVHSSLFSSTSLSSLTTLSNGSIYDTIWSSNTIVTELVSPNVSTASKLSTMFETNVTHSLGMPTTTVPIVLSSINETIIQPTSSKYGNVSTSEASITERSSQLSASSMFISTDYEESSIVVTSVQNMTSLASSSSSTTMTEVVRVPTSMFTPSSLVLESLSDLLSVTKTITVEVSSSLLISSSKITSPSESTVVEVSSSIEFPTKSVTDIALSSSSMVQETLSISTNTSFISVMTSQSLTERSSDFISVVPTPSSTVFELSTPFTPSSSLIPITSTHSSISTQVSASLRESPTSFSESSSVTPTSVTHATTQLELSSYSISQTPPTINKSEAISTFLVSSESGISTGGSSTASTIHFGTSLQETSPSLTLEPSSPSRTIHLGTTTLQETQTPLTSEPSLPSNTIHFGTTTLQETSTSMTSEPSLPSTTIQFGKTTLQETPISLTSEPSSTSASIHLRTSKSETPTSLTPELSLSSNTIHFGTSLQETTISLTLEPSSTAATIHVGTTLSETPTSLTSEPSAPSTTMQPITTILPETPPSVTVEPISTTSSLNLTDSSISSFSHSPSMTSTLSLTGTSEVLSPTATELISTVLELNVSVISSSPSTTSNVGTTLMAENSTLTSEPTTISSTSFSISSVVPTSIMNTSSSERLSSILETTAISTLTLISTSTTPLSVTSENVTSLVVSSISAIMTSTSLEMISTTSSPTVTATVGVTSSFAVNTTTTESTTTRTTTTTTTTTTLPPTTTTANASTAGEHNWVETGLKVYTSVDISSESFRNDMEVRLATAYDKAFERERLIAEGKWDPLKKRRKKRFTTVGNASVHVHRITRTGTTSLVSVVYAVEKNGTLLPAADAVNSISVLDPQELSIELGQVVNNPALPYIRSPTTVTTAVTPGPPTQEEGGTDFKLWMIGAIVGPIVFLILVVWICLCLYFKVCRAPEKEGQPVLTGLRQPVDDEEAPFVDTRMDPEFIERTSKASMGSLKSPPGKVRKYEVNPPPEVSQAQEVTENTTFQNVKSPQASKTTLNGHAVPVTSPTKASPKKKSPAKKGKKSSEAFENPMYESNPDFKTESPILQTSYSEEDDEMKEKAEIERKLNKERMRKKKRPTESMRSFMAAQEEIDAVLEAPAPNGLPHVFVESPQKQGQDTPGHGATKPGELSGFSNDAYEGEETLEEARKRMHKLLDETFALISPRGSFVETDLGKRRASIISQVSPRHSAKVSPMEAEQQQQQHASPEKKLQKKSPVKEKKHTPMHFDIPGGKSNFPLETWSPYRASDEIALISLPTMQTVIGSDVGSVSPRSAKRPVTAFPDQKKVETFLTKDPPKPIVLKSRELLKTQNGAGLAGVVGSKAARPSVQNGATDNSVTSSKSRPRSGEQNGHTNAFTGSASSLGKTKERVPSGTRRSVPNGNDMELSKLNNSSNDKIRKHRGPGTMDRNTDEVDVVRNSLKPGETTDDLIKSIRDELKHISGNLKSKSGKSMTDII